MDVLHFFIVGYHHAMEMIEEVFLYDFRGQPLGIFLLCQGTYDCQYLGQGHLEEILREHEVDLDMRSIHRLEEKTASPPNK